MNSRTLSVCLLLLIGCSASSEVPPSTSADTTAVSADTSEDTADTTSSDSVDRVDTGSRLVPAEAIAVQLLVDDTANGTYESGQMQWTGSFEWNSEDNTAVYAASWLPDDRAWPKLWDDGPRSAGGHEAEGQVADDGIHSAEIFFVPDPDAPVVLEYGVLNEFGNWIWLGPNGVLEITAETVGPVDAGLLEFPPFGDRELKLAVDFASLNEEYSTLDPAQTQVFVKGTMNSWTPVQLLDDGNAGDDTAGDGVYTYLHSTKLGPHDGLAFPGQHVQFVFVFSVGDGGAEDGLEYKLGPDALPDGVRAWSGTSEELVEESIILELDSKGKGKNTALIVSGSPEPPPPPSCGNEESCPDGETCVDGQCVPDVAPMSLPTVSIVSPAEGSGQGGTSVTVFGTDFQEGAEVFFAGEAATEIEVESEGTLTCVTPAGTLGPVDVTVTNPDGGSGTFAGGYTYTDAVAGLAVASFYPSLGTLSGGTTVTIQGQEFSEEAQVLFGDVPASSVTVYPPSTIEAVAPAHASGYVNVSVTVDGQTAMAAEPFGFGQVATPVMDGLIGEDWPNDYVLATDSVTGWDFNDLNTVSVAFDETYLYLAVEGELEAQNVLVAFLDFDYGTGAGASPESLTDQTGALDNALSGSAIQVSDAGFGAEFAVGGFGGANQMLGGDLQGNSGWRGLANPEDLAWLSGDVQWGADGVEMRIAWDALGTLPQAPGRTLGAFVRIVNESGEYVAPDGLPASSSGDGSVDSVVTVWLP